MESVNLKALTKTEIFAGATEEEVSSMLNCLSAKKKKYQKDEIIFHAGDIVSSIGVMLKGNALIENDDIWGNRSVLDYVKEGQIFAETYACALDEKLMVNVIAMSDCEVLFLEFLVRLRTVFSLFRHRTEGQYPQSAFDGRHHDRTVRLP